MVQEFLEKLQVKEGTYIFAAVTRGGMDGIAHDQIRNILSPKYLVVSARFSFHFPASNQTSYAPAPLSEQQKLFSMNQQLIKQTIEQINHFDKIKTSNSPFMGYSRN